MNCILLLCNGDIRDVKITTKNVKKPKLSDLIIKKDVFESLGSGKLSIIGEWSINNFTLIGYGFSEGEEENNHELPPSFETNQKYFGDILLVKIDSSNNSAEDLRNGILNAEIGLSLLRPAEFIIFRFSQSAGAGITVEE